MKITLLPSQELTASGAGSWIPKKTASMMGVSVNITAGSGTVLLDMWIEGSSDGSTDTDGDDLIADHTLLDANAAAEGASDTNVRDVVAAKATTAAARYMAMYKHCPWEYVRVRWTLTGSSPSLTLSVVASAM